MRMRFRFNWKFITLSFIGVISIAPYLGAICIKTFIYPDIKFSSPEKRLGAEECSKLIGNVCSKALFFNTNEIPNDLILVPGITASAPRISCLHQEKSSISTADIFYGSNAYQTNEINKCKNGIVVYFRTDLDSAYGSWIIPYLIIGEPAHVETLTRSVIFFRSELRTIFSGIAPFQVALLFFLLSILGTGNKPPFQFTFITVSIMALVNGGVIEKALFLPSNLFSPETKEFLGFLILSIFAVESRYKKPKLKYFLYTILFSIILEIFCYQIKVSKEIIWTLVITGWLVITISSRFDFATTTFFILNCFYLASVLTPYNLIPPYAGTLFFMIYFLGIQIEHIRLRLLNWRINQMSRSISSQKRLEALVKLISKIHHIERVSLSLVKNETFVHLGYSRKKHRTNKLESKSISNVVSRVYANGKALVHINTSVDHIGKKLSNNGSEYRSNHFSSFPIQINGQLWGVLSFTDYSNSILHQGAVEALHGVFLECSEIVAKSLSQVTNKFANEFEECFIKNIESSSDASLVTKIHPTLEYIFNKYNVSCYFSEISQDDTIKLLFASGFLNNLIRNINENSFKVSTTNEFGPIALAFKESEPVVLQNWKPISDKISQAAADVYRKTNANSILTVPLILSVGDSKFRYLLWMQTSDERVFGTDFKRVAKIIQTKLSQTLEKQINLFMNDTVLSLADSSAIQNLVNGRDASIKESGELLMFDLCKSTQLSISLGNKNFHELCTKYRDIVTLKMKLVGFRLQMIIGDALLFTKPSSNEMESINLIETIYDCETLISHQIKKYGLSVFTPEEACIRVCLVQGDISRGVIKGTGTGWAITGSTISEVHKVEAVAKKFRSGLYFELKNEKSKFNESLTGTGVLAWLNGPEVCYLNFNPACRKKAA